MSAFAARLAGFASAVLIASVIGAQAKDAPGLTVGNFVEAGDAITEAVETSGVAFPGIAMLSAGLGDVRPRFASLQRQAPGASAQTFETACPGGGSVKVGVRDADDSGDLSTRDRFSTSFESCVMDGQTVSGHGDFVVAGHRFEGSTEITELEFRFKDLGTAQLRWTGSARVTLHSDLRRGTERYILNYQDLLVTRGARSVRWNFTLDLVRPPIGDQVASLHGAMSIGDLRLRLRQDDAFVIAGDGFPHSGQLTAIDETGAQLQIEAGRWRYAYRLFRAGNRGVMPDSTSQSRPHGPR